MSQSNLLQDFRAAYQSLQMLPLKTAEDWYKYHVPYDTDEVERLQQVIEDCCSANNKIVFTGHMGCGKSTLLNDVARRVDKDFFVVLFSIADVVEMSDVNHINILFAIGVQMMAVAQAKGIKLAQSLREELDNWFTTITQTQTEEPISAVLTGVFDFLVLKGQLKTSAVTRREIKRIFSPRASELIDKLNNVAEAIEAASGQEVLVIIDDLDKLDLGVAQDVYAKHIKTLFQPEFRIIFTVPMASLREMNLQARLTGESNGQLRSMSVTQLYAKPPKETLTTRRPPEMREPITKALDTFKKILERRIPERLIEPEAVELMVHYSGGVLRELIRLAHGCCGECLLQVRRESENLEIKITTDVVEKVVKDLRNDFAKPASEPFYRILMYVYQTLSDPVADDVGHQKFLNLLHSLYILEYEDDEVWYDVHPIVVELLEQKGRFLA
ncbi:MAG: ATP-binding protein [Cyanobacteria bacterium P01_G01_bin.54]